MTPLLGMRVMKSYFLFDMFVDHDFIETKLGWIRFFDQTNWPFTVDPEKVLSIKDLPEEKEFVGFYKKKKKGEFLLTIINPLNHCPNKQ